MKNSIIAILILIVSLLCIEAQTSWNDNVKMRDSIAVLQTRNQDISARLSTAEQKIESIRQRIVTVTAYNPVEAQTDSTPRITACNTAVAPWTIAVSEDLFSIGWTCGKKVRLRGVGIVIINDVMHNRKTNQVDFFLEDVKDAQAFGIKIGVKAILLNL